MRTLFGAALYTEIIKGQVTLVSAPRRLASKLMLNILLRGQSKELAKCLQSDELVSDTDVEKELLSEVCAIKSLTSHLGKINCVQIMNQLLTYAPCLYERELLSEFCSVKIHILRVFCLS